MKKRQYHYIQGKDPANPSQLKYITRDIECDDTFDGDLVMLAFPIALLKEISTVLSQFHLRNDSEYFYSECKEVVSVPEKHVNEKGEGQITFQSYFHKFPESVQYFFEDAIVVVLLHPQEATDAQGNHDYNMIGYIHANLIDFKDHTANCTKAIIITFCALASATLTASLFTAASACLQACSASCSTL